MEWRRPVRSARSRREEWYDRDHDRRGEGSSVRVCLAVSRATSIRGMLRTNLRWCPWAFALSSSLQSCTPIPSHTDEDDALVLEKVVAAARGATDPEPRLSIHPYLAVATDSSGALLYDVTSFEYSPAKPLRLLADRDSTLNLCEPNAYGSCQGNYIILSQVIHVSDRDVVVLITSMPSRTKRLLVRVRFGRSGWVVSGIRTVP